MSAVLRRGVVNIKFRPQPELIKGVMQVSRAVGVTLGPRGRNVVIQYQHGSPRITKDGVTVARSVSLPQPLEEMGAAICRSASGESNKLAGDGTTTTTLLTAELIQAGHFALERGVKLSALRQGFKMCEKELSDFLRLSSTEVLRPHQLFSIARVSTNDERELASLVVNAALRSNFRRSLSIEEGKGVDSQLVVDECFKITRSPKEVFLEQGKLVLEYPLVLLLGEPLLNLRIAADLLAEVRQAKRPLVIFCPQFSKDVSEALHFNHSRKIVRVCPLSLKGEQGFVLQQLSDLALLFRTAVFYLKDLPGLLASDLGDAKLLKADNIETTIYGARPDPKKLAELTQKLTAEQSSYAKERLKRVNLKQVTLIVGGNNEVEMREKRDKIIDSYNAVIKAKEFGILPGCGVALLRASCLLDLLEFEDDRVREVLRAALRLPFELLAAGCRKQQLEAVESGPFATGIDLRTGEVCDLVERGVVQSSEGVVVNLRTALSTALTLLGTEVAITKRTRYVLPSSKEMSSDYNLNS